MNQLAKGTADIVSGDHLDDPYNGKNPSAVELGRRRGFKGGKARPARLSPAKRTEIAKQSNRG